MTGKKDPLSFMTMEFDTSNISWEGGKLIFEWWLKARGESKFPSRKDFNPSKFKAQLPFIMIVDVENENGKPEFYIRLSGTKISDKMKLNPQNRNIKDLEGGEHIYKRIMVLIETGKPYLATNIPLSWSKNDHKFYNGLMLPFSSNGHDINKILVNLYIP